MREVSVEKIIDTVKELCIESNYYLGDDIRNGLKDSIEKEEYPLANDVLKKIYLNADIARDNNMPICQDTGMACVFVELGQDVHITGGSLEDAINEGVRRGYEEGFLRKSVVKDPLNRVNTKDNTPAIIYYDIVKGDKVKITVAPKGFGSENMSRIAMLKPSDGIEGVKKFILETVENAGPNPCPPMVVGVGIGGTFDKAAYLAKKALLRPIDQSSEIEFYKELEEELIEEINKLGIGPQGFGGRTTALGINIEVYPTHIAGLPVAVNINCHATRHKEREV
ncbi:fumarate hydratase [Clostridium sp. NSJ-49]|uniref:Fumarate hydratase n=1 Tax=Clostridium disporicum TaxID=84024 RepID=A0A174C344_9CLOT|nr:MULTISPECIES: fumarate hydratase [Clostridium]MBC5625320.1 fumarate hydratase [Clostridium sp. NSJ-49]MCD2501431.1 fumarate hydratase [Clostridium sp. NSJ-145]CUO07544.1 fumarate hydratase [Clostridium disporicum]